MGPRKYICPIAGCTYEAMQNEFTPATVYSAPRCPCHPTYFRAPTMIPYTRLSEHASGTAVDINFRVPAPEPITLDGLREMQNRINRDVAKLAALTHTPTIHIQGGRLVDDYEIIRQFTSTINAGAIKRAGQTPEQEFAALDVQEGDRVRLTEVKNYASTVFQPARRELVKDGSSLEGKIIGIKVRNGKTQLRFAGFGHTGPNKAGGQHVWFAVENYKVEVLHKVYRITEEDKLFVELAGLTVERWAALTEQQRADRRERYAVRADKIRKLLAP